MNGLMIDCGVSIFKNGIVKNKMKINTESSKRWDKELLYSLCLYILQCQKPKGDVKMKRAITFCLVLFLMSVFCLATYAQQITVAFIGDKANMKDHNKAAYEWAQKTYNAPLIASGDIAKTDLTKYAVIWWHDGEADPTAQVKDCADALMI